MAPRDDWLAITRSRWPLKRLSIAQGSISAASLTKLTLEDPVLKEKHSHGVKTQVRKRCGVSSKKRRYTVNYKVVFTGHAGVFDAQSSNGRADVKDNQKAAWDQVKKDLQKLDYDQITYELSCDKCGELVFVPDGESEAQFNCECSFEAS